MHWRWSGWYPTLRMLEPLPLAFTKFPGVFARFGLWHTEAYPRCGCDACDESPDELIEIFKEGVDALVAGEFTEAIEGDWLAYHLGRSSGRARLGRDDRRRLYPGSWRWAAWSVRRPAP